MATSSSGMGFNISQDFARNNNRIKTYSVVAGPLNAIDFDTCSKESFQSRGRGGGRVYVVWNLFSRGAANR
jgi:hypothetical protein